MGATANYIAMDNYVHIRADVLSSVTNHVDPTRVLVKMTLADYYLVKHATAPLKIFQAKSFQDPSWEGVVLDCTGPDAVIVSQVHISSHEHLAVAELFAGGFQGWSQASWLLHQKHVPLSMTWAVEKAADCVPMQRHINPGQMEIASVSELFRCRDQDQFLMIVGDIWENWWLRTYNLRPINAMAVSAPCQPWSFAGRETGLNNTVGQLMLRVIDIAAALAIEFVILEQVAGFRAHPHYNRVMKCWDDAGFSVCWKATLDLADVLPCHRSRHLIILRNRSIAQPAIAPAFTWKCPDPGNLQSVQALLDLPPGLQAQCTPSPETLSLYLNPALIPHLKNVSDQAKIRDFRVRKGHQATTCFMAQYSYAHLLPFDLLEGKGLFGSLAEAHGTVRFFSPPEVASLHGTIRPTLCQSNRRLAMRLLGNAISVPHAAIGLIQCCHTAGLALQISAESVIQACLACRLHNGNAVFVPCGHDWLLTPLHEACRSLCIAQEPAMSVPRVDDLFRRLTLQTAEGDRLLHVARHISLRELLRGLHLEAAAGSIPEAFDT